MEKLLVERFAKACMAINRVNEPKRALTSLRGTRLECHVTQEKHGSLIRKVEVRGTQLSQD